MLSEVWRWAGSYRVRDTNLGVPWAYVGVSVEDTVRDMNAQIASMPPDEVAVRFHHRLVSVHPFPNGNGRHTRLAADTLVVALQEERFTWGVGAGLAEAGPTRDRYLDALRCADRGDLEPLLAFARS
jgi:Fic-DOC domain mobile mystery protein B